MMVRRATISMSVPRRLSTVMPPQTLSTETSTAAAGAGDPDGLPDLVLFHDGIDAIVVVPDGEGAAGGEAEEGQYNQTHRPLRVRSMLTFARAAARMMRDFDKGNFAIRKTSLRCAPAP